jgi:hypothetical protein
VQLHDNPHKEEQCHEIYDFLGAQENELYSTTVLFGNGDNVSLPHTQHIYSSWSGYKNRSPHLLDALWAQTKALSQVDFLQLASQGHGLDTCKILQRYIT